MQISIIIPTYNEEKSIGKLLHYLKQQGTACLKEIIVADAGSADSTQTVAAAAGAHILQSPKKGRAAQMNFGASYATGDILYFVHADTFPPPGFCQDIIGAVVQGFDLGRYKTKFDSSRPLLRINAWFTRFDLFICMGGDQTLFIRKSYFDSLGGFNEDLTLMEEYEFCQRARVAGNYKIMNGFAIISARKYEKNSWLQVQLANKKMVQLYKKGASQESMVQEYKRRLRF